MRQKQDTLWRCKYVAVKPKASPERGVKFGCAELRTAAGGGGVLSAPRQRNHVGQFPFLGLAQDSGHTMAAKEIVAVRRVSVELHSSTRSVEVQVSITPPAPCAQCGGWSK